MLDRTSLKSRIPLYSVYFLGFIGDFNLSLIQMSMVLFCSFLGGSTVQVGWIGTAYGASYCFIPAILGALTDKIPRKKSLIIATSLQSLVSILFIFSFKLNEIGAFFPISILVLIGFGISYSFFWSNVEAFISEYTEHSEKEHEKAISNFCVFWGLGSTLGAWAGGYIFEFNIQTAPIVTLVFFMIALLIATFIIPISSRNHHISTEMNSEIMVVSSSSQDTKTMENEQVPKESVGNKILIIILLSNLMFAFISRLFSSYFPNYAILPEGLGFDGEKIGNITLFFGIFRILYFYIGRYLSKSLASLTQSIIFSGVFILFLYFFDHISIIVIIFMIMGFLNGRLYYIALMLLMKHEKEKKSTKAGFFEAMVGVGSSTSPIIAGSLALVSLRFPFLIYSIFILVIGIISSYFLRKKSK